MSTDTPPKPGREKVAILGGGMAALSAAFALTDRPGWSDRFDVTIYPLGWRLGGKGASGRNAQVHDRIEEHGLHVWGGFYENAFQIMRRCYAELAREPGSPLATWLQAFRPHNFIVWEEFIDGQWLHWPVELPANGALPGEGHELLPLWEYLRMALEWMLDAIRSSRHGVVRAEESEARLLPGWLSGILPGFGHFTVDVTAASVPSSPAPVSPAPVVSPAPAEAPQPSSVLEHFEHTFLNLAHHLVGTCDARVVDHPPDVHRGVFWLVREFMDWFHNRIRDEIAEHTETRRLWCLLDFCATSIRGILADGVLTRGFTAIDGEDLIDWLRRHGARELTLGSAAVRAYYDYFFAFEDGDTDKPTLAAGTGLLHLLRLTLTYKTSIFWKMEAGMGDAVFGPLYEVLHRRGVKFQFFHRVKSLGLSADKRSIAEIRVGRQVTLKSPEYQPLVMVKGLPCWPSGPLLDQIVEGDELKARGIDLESPWSGWEDVEELTLRAGADCDWIVLGITLAPLKAICAELIAESPAWSSMFANVKTVQTLAAQFWFEPDAAGLGWSMPRAVGAGYDQPLDSWADFSNLIAREGWPGSATPGALTYFCGPLKESDPIPDVSDHDFPAREQARVQEIVARWLDANAAHLWPAARSATDPNGLNWDVLIDSGGRQGRERLGAQYLRANVNPAERFVLSVPGDSQYRLGAGESGFANLILAGDWTFTGLGGCIEGAAMSGLLASRALAGYPETIIGEVVR